MKRTKKTVLAAVLAAALTLALTGCGAAPAPAAPAPTEVPAAEPAEAVFENAGLTLRVPAEIADKVTVEMEEERLFNVSENASLEAAESSWQSGT